METPVFAVFSTPAMDTTKNTYIHILSQQVDFDGTVKIRVMHCNDAGFSVSTATNLRPAHEEEAADSFFVTNSVEEAETIAQIWSKWHKKRVAHFQKQEKRARALISPFPDLSLERNLYSDNQHPHFKLYREVMYHGEKLLDWEKNGSADTIVEHIISWLKGCNRAVPTLNERDEVVSPAPETEPITQQEENTAEEVVL